MTPAQLGARRIARTIEDIEPGETAWTVPWAMSLDLNGRAYLAAKYLIEPTPGGTVTMRVTRTPHGYVVDIRQCDHRWQPGTGWFDIPVVEVIDHDPNIIEGRVVNRRLPGG